ncbi:disease resistance protein RPV1-like isoform X1 [Vitis riparia]|uniref:disease resistance protein RPV1-like isoform X1 n=1 Tax=Vitis riparia TaxID=96939 RepID=UPI00155AD8F1|nr:disease resistance protein RPV1-like isoform X1 [Vitis riparia]XP_034701739.1 disease resistance protein RPV1-like isoform X1 [Vitis riparia]
MASTSFFTASASSTPSIPQRIHDVFLSFRGVDTRCNFTDHLYKALVDRGIRTFRDDKLRRGEGIAPELSKAIEESRSSVIVFSENYARSRWCLDELVKIMECQKDLGHAVFPIFYHVDPSHVRKQEGSFGAAFAGYEANWKDKVGNWRTALTEAANLSGWHLQDGYETDYIKEITNNIFHRLNCKRFDVGANLVGIDSRIKEVSLLLHMESSDVCVVGIYGVGGIGKTTIAKVIYNKLSCKFEYMSFLENIRGISNTKGLTHLQNQLLGDIRKEERSQNINIVDQGASMIETILSSKRVFIVLDDVDNRNQLKALLRHRGWLGKGSRVIITTRNKHLLIEQEVDDLYEVKGLNTEEACELFSLHAFKQNLPKSNFINLSHRMVDYCQGLPLALEVLGSLLFNMTIPQWESQLHKLAKEPMAEIHNVLKSSYDGLDRTEKDILLDVACFLKGEKRDSVLRILDASAGIGIQNLKDKCLITLTYNHMIDMHDLIQQMCWEIVRENFPKEPNKWSRLWDSHDIERALTTSEGIKGVETIDLDLSKLKRLHFNSNVFSKMTSLRLLRVHSNVYIFLRCYDDMKEEEEEVDPYYEKIIDSVKKTASKVQLDLDFEIPSNELRYLCWDGYPLDSLPSNFDGENLVELHLKCSNIKQLWQGNKYLESLKVIDLSYSTKLVQMPEFSSLSNLERLILKGCVSLIDIHPSLGVLKKLTTLNLRLCHKLKGLPSSISNLESLELLDLSKCSRFGKFSEIQGNMRCPWEPYLKEIAIKEHPTSIENSRSFWDLDPCGHSNLEKFPGIQGNMRSLRLLYLSKTAIKELPGSIDLESVESLDLSYCSKFEKFPENGANMKSLRELDLTHTAIKELPIGISNWESLRTLDLSKCSKFEKFPAIQGNMRNLKELLLNNTAIKCLPDSIGYLKSLEILNVSDCSKFEKFPEKGGNMKNLKQLLLKNTPIKDLPDGIGELESLEILDLSDSSKFEKFPEKGGNMKSLGMLYLTNTAIKDLPNSIGSLESLVELDLSNCSKFEKFPEKGGNMKSLVVLRLMNTAIKDLPDSIGSLESLVELDLSNCSKFEKFPEKGGNMKSLVVLRLMNTAIKDLPDSIGSLESLVELDLSNCLKFEKFPEKGGNMKSLGMLYLTNTAIKDLPDSIGSLESLVELDLSNCSKFEKFPEKGGNMKSLVVLRLMNTAIKDLPDSIGSLESLVELDLSNCSKFEKFPEKGGNMKRLGVLYLTNTAIKDLPDSIGSLDLVDLDLSNCSQFEKFPELKRSMLELRTLNLRRTAIKELPSSIDNVSGLWDLDISDCKNLRSLPDDISRLEFLESLILGGCSNLWEGLISNQLRNLGKLNTSQWKMAEKTLELPSSLERIDAHHCTGKEDLSSLLWLCHLNWLKSATEELKCWKLSAVIPESSGIPEWIRSENLGSELTTELPTNWYEDPDLLGFVVSCVYQPIPTSHDPRISYHFSSAFSCELNLHGNGFGFKDERRFGCRCECQGNFNDMIDQVWVWWYPKIAIPKEHLHNSTHINASFKSNTYYCDASVNVKKCGINLIFAGDQQNHMPMLEHPQNSGDNGSALQDTNGNVHGANPMFLDLDGNFGGNGSVVLEDTVGNRKRRRDDSLPDVAEEPHYKRLGAPNTDLSH